VRGPGVTPRVDQGMPLVLGCAEPVHLPHRDLHDPIGLRVQPGGLHVHQGEPVTQVESGGVFAGNRKRTWIANCWSPSAKIAAGRRPRMFGSVSRDPDNALSAHLSRSSETRGNRGWPEQQQVTGPAENACLVMTPSEMATIR